MRIFAMCILLTNFPVIEKWVCFETGLLCYYAKILELWSYKTALWICVVVFFTFYVAVY